MPHVRGLHRPVAVVPTGRHAKKLVNFLALVFGFNPGTTIIGVWSLICMRNGNTVETTFAGCAVAMATPCPVQIWKLTEQLMEDERISDRAALRSILLAAFDRSESIMTLDKEFRLTSRAQGVLVNGSQHSKT